MKVFKKIILATDFSDNAHTAFHYAQQVALRLKAELRVVNVYEIPINPGNPELTDFMPNLEELASLSKTRLENFVSEHKQDGGDTMVVSRVKITTDSMIGFPAERLIELSSDPSVDLIVVGCAGEHSWMDKIMGSVAIQVATEAHCPVLLVPHKAQSQSMNHFLYAASFYSTSPRDIRIALDWTKHFMGNINFLHINTSGNKEPQKADLFFDDLLNQERTKVPITFDSVLAESIPDGIQNYTKENLIDMIFIVTRHRTFWENMTHASVTKALAWNSQIPIMVLHSDDKEHPPV